MNDERGAFIEIVERRKKPEPGSKDWGIVIPNKVRVNGQEIAIPRGEPITVHDLGPDDAVMVTLTVYAQRVFVGHENIDESVIDEVAGATNALLDAQRRAMTAQADAIAAVETARAELGKVHAKLAEATRD